MKPLIINYLFNDDRQYVLEISRATTRTLTGESNKKHEWCAVTRRNVPGFPPSRIDNFDSKSEAEAFYKCLVAETPLVSQGGKPPDPIPSIEEYTSWLRAERLFDPLLNPSI